MVFSCLWSENFHQCIMLDRSQIQKLWFFFYCAIYSFASSGYCSSCLLEKLICTFHLCYYILTSFCTISNICLWHFNFFLIRSTGSWGMKPHEPENDTQVYYFTITITELDCKLCPISETFVCSEKCSLLISNKEYFLTYPNKRNEGYSLTMFF